MLEQKKILYLSTWDFTNEYSDGVCKKMKAQIAAFEKKGFHVDFIYISNGQILFRKDGGICEIGKVGSVKKTPAYIKMYKYLKNEKYDYVYNRYGMMDTFYFRVLKKLHKNGAKILIEIPTYPYVGERQKGFAYWLMFKWDALYTSKLNRVVERIVTYSDDKMIFDIPTIYIMNGIDTAEILPKSSVKTDSSICLLALAYMQPHHGYERLLRGLRDYYKIDREKEVQCLLVGDGPEVAFYKDLVKEYNIQTFVHFMEAKKGAELDAIFEKADIGICSLGAYKKKLFLSSELKSREYFAKGILICAGVVVDSFRNVNSEYYLEFPNDDSTINICEIVRFYKKIYEGEKNRETVIKEIRTYAENYMDIIATMQPVCQYMLDR